MRPILFEIGDFTLPSYYTLLTLGFLAAVFLAWREAPRKGIDPDDLLDMALYALIAGLLGARLLHVVADGYFWDYVHLCTDPLKVEVPSFIHVPCATDADCVAADAGALCHPDTGRCHPARDCFAALKFWHGGLAFLGGFLGAVGVCFVFLRRRGIPFLKAADLGSFGVPLGLGIGRLGCLLSGCCYGQVTTGPLGLRFTGFVTRAGPDLTCPPNYDLLRDTPQGPLCAFGRPAFLDHAEHGLLELGADHSLPVHPTQAYEAAFALGLFAFFYFWRRRRIRFDGQGIWEFCVAYPIGRFAIEFFRADDRGLWLGDTLSTSQLIAIPVVGYAHLRLRRGPRGAS